MDTIDSFTSVTPAFVPAEEVKVSAGIVRNWSPPRVPRKELLEWTTATAELATVRHLAGQPTREALVNLMSEIHVGSTFAIDQSPQKDCRQCDAGCADCCHVMIAVTAPEVFVLADYLRSNRTAEELGHLHRRVEAVSLQTMHLDRHQYTAAKVACPLLTPNNNCAAYPARPIRCQSRYSLSQERCQDYFASQLIDEKIPLDAFAYTIGQGIGAGLSAGLCSLGMDGNFYELGSAMAIALQQPDAAQKWLDGVDVFKDCKQYQ